MKKILSLGFTIALATSLFAQAATTVPQNVQDAFRSKFPNVSAVTWTEKEGYFKPKFTAGGKETTGYVDLKGHVIQTEVNVGTAGLPAAAATYIRQNYAGAQIGEAGRIDFFNEHPSRFYAVVNGQTLVFEKDGGFIKVSTSPLKQ